MVFATLFPTINTCQVIFHFLKGGGGITNSTIPSSLLQQDKFHIKEKKDV